MKTNKQEVEKLMEEFDQKWPIIETEIGDDHPLLTLRDIREHHKQALQTAYEAGEQKNNPVNLIIEGYNKEKEILSTKLAQLQIDKKYIGGKTLSERILQIDKELREIITNPNNSKYD